MNTTPNFRALCAELVEAYAWCIERYMTGPAEKDALVLRTRAALEATPQPEQKSSIDELIAGCKPLDPEMAEALTTEARWRLFGEDGSATPPPEPPTIGNVEDAAKAIYSDAMTWAAKNSLAGITPPWVEGGNSTAQDVARQVARSLATPPPEPPTDEEIAAWADDCSEAPLEEMDPEVHGWRRCFTAKEFSETIRAALEKWGR